jgi:hypothetical protein
MDVWVIGGGIYAVLLFFAMALCRVAGSDDSDTRTGAFAAKPRRTNVEYERLVGVDGVRIDVAVQGDTGYGVPHPGSRPGAGTLRSREPRMVPARHQQFIER